MHAACSVWGVCAPSLCCVVLSPNKEGDGTFTICFTLHAHTAPAARCARGTNSRGVGIILHGVTRGKKAGFLGA